MILLLIQSPRSEECREQLEQRLGQPVVLCTSLRDAIAAVRANQLQALVLDQNVLEASPAQSATLARSTGTAVTVFINPAIWGVERICKEIEFSLERARRERTMTEQAVRNELKERLCGAVTGILLSSELALNAESLPPLVEEKLKSVRALAMQMSDCLRQTAQ